MAWIDFYLKSFAVAIKFCGALTELLEFIEIDSNALDRRYYTD